MAWGSGTDPGSDWLDCPVPNPPTMPPYDPAQPGGPGAIAFTGRSAAAAADAAAASKDATAKVRLIENVRCLTVSKKCESPELRADFSNRLFE
jgi:hypothetical protein